jgi:hypothetical protein
MNFFEAMQSAYEGKAVYRREWERKQYLQFAQNARAGSLLLEKHGVSQSINAVRLSVQVGNDKRRPEFPGVLVDGEYKGQIAAFSHEDVAAQDWELVEDVKKSRRAKADKEDDAE